MKDSRFGKGDLALLEKALSKLGLQFAWEEEEFFILDSEKITGEPLHVRGILRPGSLQLSVTLSKNPSPEQSGVLFWQEWRRRGEATFCMIDEEREKGEVLLALRLPLYQVDSSLLAAMIRSALLSLARSYPKRQELLEDVG